MSDQIRNLSIFYYVNIICSEIWVRRNLNSYGNCPNVCSFEASFSTLVNTQRHNNVITTLQRHCNDVVATLCVCWVVLTSSKMFSFNSKNYFAHIQKNFHLL